MALNQVFVQPQKTSDYPRYFRYKLNMQNAMCNVVIFKQIKNLSFINVTGIGKRMNNSVCVMEKNGSDIFPIRSDFPFGKVSPASITPHMHVWIASIFLY